EELYDPGDDPHEWHNLLYRAKGSVEIEDATIAIRDRMAVHLPQLNRSPEEGRQIYGGTPSPAKSE
ncbi:MAG: hypothetical protein AAGJ97_09585, partial [Planctomycetota bacterium]